MNLLPGLTDGFRKCSVHGVQSHLKFSKIYGGSEPPSQNFFKLCKKVASYHANYNAIIKNGGHRARFEL